MKRYATYALCLPLTAALLAACGGGGGNTTTGPAPVLPVAAPITTVNGTVSGWTGGASTVELLSQPTAKSATNPALASATLNANGTFALTLPSLATITPYLSTAATGSDSTVSGSTACNGTRTNSDPSALGYSFGSLSAGNNPVISGTSSISTSVDTNTTTATFNGRQWVYSTKPTTFSGSVVCTDAPSGFTFTTSYNVALTQGWNVLAVAGTSIFSADGKSTITTFSYAATTDAPSTWYLVPVGAQSLQAQGAAARFVSAQATFGKLLGGHFGF